MNQPDVLEFQVGTDRILLRLTIHPNVIDAMSWEQWAAIVDGIGVVLRAAKPVAWSKPPEPVAPEESGGGEQIDPAATATVRTS